MKASHTAGQPGAQLTYSPHGSRNCSAGVRPTDFFRRWVEDVFFFLQARCSFLVRMTSQAQGSRFPRLDVPIGELQDDVFFIFLVLGWHLALDVPLKAVHYWCLVVLPAFNPFV